MIQLTREPKRTCDHCCERKDVILVAVGDRYLRVCEEGLLLLMKLIDRLRADATTSYVSSS